MTLNGPFTNQTNCYGSRFGFIFFQNSTHRDQSEDACDEQKEPTTTTVDLQIQARTLRWQSSVRCMSCVSVSTGCIMVMLISLLIVGDNWVYDTPNTLTVQWAHPSHMSLVLGLVATLGQIAGALDFAMTPILAILWDLGLFTCSGNYRCVKIDFISVKSLCLKYHLCQQC